MAEGQRRQGHDRHRRAGRAVAPDRGRTSRTHSALQFQLIPYRGTPQVLADLIAGQIDLVFDQASSALPLVRGGKVKTYGVTALQAAGLGARHSDAA